MFDESVERDIYGYADDSDDEDPGPHGGPAQDTWEEETGEDPDVVHGDGEDDE